MRRDLQEHGGRRARPRPARRPATDELHGRGHEQLVIRLRDRAAAGDRGGHALASEAGISCLLRRTYKGLTEPAAEGDYDFVSYFECADAHVPVYHQVCDALRDVTRNPEWQFVREAPTWHGRRVASWEDLFT